MKYKVKNWEQFQHYKNRRPPWIKLHRTLLDDCDFLRLQPASRALAPLIWLLASESDDGTITDSIERLSYRLRLPEKEIEEGVKGLLSIGYITCYQDASAVLAPCKQEARVERERETETERETEGELASSGKPADAAATQELPAEKKPKAPKLATDADWLAAIKDHYGKLGIDVDRELAKAQGWLMGPKGKGRKLTQQFFLNWLGKCDRDLPGVQTNREIDYSKGF